MLGCMIAETLQEAHPFPSVVLQSCNDDIEQRKEPKLDFESFFPGSVTLKDLLLRMLSHSAESRPTIEEVLAHPSS